MQLCEWLFPLKAFRELGAAPRRPEQTEVVEAPGVTHLRYRFD